jgi:hypothetical protein
MLLYFLKDGELCVRILQPHEYIKQKNSRSEEKKAYYKENCESVKLKVKAYYYKNKLLIAQKRKIYYINKNTFE